MQAFCVLIAHACIIKTSKPSCTRLHNLLALTPSKNYIWQTASRRAGQLAGIKLDPWVPHCSLGLKSTLKASPIDLQQWENMDSGQGKAMRCQPHPWRTASALRLHPGPLMFSMTYHLMCPYAICTSLHVL